MGVYELKNPKFLFCENPIKTGDKIEDNRMFIYCVEYLSLIEIIPMDLYLSVFPDEVFQKTYYYEEEEFLLVIRQNNIELINSYHDIEIFKGERELMFEERLMDLAWEYFESYLKWENSQNL